MGGNLQRDRVTAIDHVVEFVDGYASVAPGLPTGPS